MHPRHAHSFRQGGWLHFLAALHRRHHAVELIPFELGKEMEEPLQIPDKLLQLTLIQMALDFGGNDGFVPPIGCADSFFVVFAFFCGKSPLLVSGDVNSGPWGSCKAASAAMKMENLYNRRYSRGRIRGNGIICGAQKRALLRLTAWAGLKSLF